VHQRFLRAYKHNPDFAVTLGSQAHDARQQCNLTSPVYYEAVVPASLSLNGTPHSSEGADPGTAVDACSAAGYAQPKVSTLAPRMNGLVPDQRERDHDWEGGMEVSCFHIYLPISTHRRAECISTSACFSGSTTFQAVPPCQRHLDIISKIQWG
jgi:hypothetical protein